MSDYKQQMQKNSQELVALEDHVLGDPAILTGNFTPKICVEKQQKQMDSVDRGVNIHPLSSKNSIIY